MTIDYVSMLAESRDEKYASFSSKLTPGKDRIIGVRIPRIREIAKLIVRDDWSQILGREPESHEEEILMGIVIATAPVGTEERISLTEGYLDRVDNWAACDIFCSSWKLTKKDSGIVWDYFSSLMDSGLEFRMRVSVIARMSLFKDEEHCRMLLEDLAAHDNPGYYYRMGSAWAVSMIYVRYPEMTEEFLRSGRLEPWTHNRSIQKIRESLRVSDADKARLAQLRRSVP